MSYVLDLTKPCIKKDVRGIRLFSQCYDIEKKHPHPHVSASCVEAAVPNL